MKNVKKIISTLIFINILFSDQAAYLTKEQAILASQYLEIGIVIADFCLPCGDQYAKLIKVETVDISFTGYENFFEILLNGKGIDLAYTYIERDGYYENLAIICGISVEKAPRFITVSHSNKVFYTLENKKPYVAIVEFDGKGVSEDEVSALTDRLLTELFQTGYYNVIEREMMDEILTEQGFQLSGCVSNECIVEIGKLIGVEQIVGGSISKVGNVYSISARIVSVESGEIIKTATYDHIGELGDLLRFGMKVVAMKLTGIEVSSSTEIQLTQTEQTKSVKYPNNRQRNLFNSYKAYTIGIESFGLPYVSNGNFGSIWIGKKNWKFRFSFAQISTPEVFWRDGFEKDKSKISAMNIEYVFGRNYSGFWFGSGIMTFDGSLGHKEEIKRGKYEIVRLGFTTGYIVKIIHNFYINIWGGLYVLIIGDTEVPVGRRTAYFDEGTPILSLDIGWHI